MEAKVLIEKCIHKSDTNTLFDQLSFTLWRQSENDAMEPWYGVGVGRSDAPEEVIEKSLKHVGIHLGRFVTAQACKTIKIETTASPRIFFSTRGVWLYYPVSRKELDIIAEAMRGTLLE